jgi:hypothetical protein
MVVALCQFPISVFDLLLVHELMHAEKDWKLFWLLIGIDTFYSPTTVPHQWLMHILTHFALLLMADARFLLQGDAT